MPVTNVLRATARGTSESKDRSMLLLRCPYPYGVSSTSINQKSYVAQTWMPIDLEMVASKLNAVGIAVDVVDLNIESLPDDIGKYTKIGIGVIGPPYIPISRRLSKHVFDITGKPSLIGGPGIEYLSNHEFSAIYGESGMQIKNDLDLGAAFSLPVQIPNTYYTPISQRIRLMNAQKLETYLKSEFSFMLSQGCKYACSFCEAVRTRDGNVVRETFSNTIVEDLSTICEMANGFGIKQLNIYTTSLDFFQTPKKIKEVLKDITDVRRKYNMDFRLRGLSRIDSFLTAIEKEPELRDLINSSGLRIMGFGVDGSTEAEWKSQGKGNRSLHDAELALKICNEIGITPEALMVLGFHNKNKVRVGNRHTLQQDAEFSIRVAELYGAVARPHLAKDITPGGSSWRNPLWEKERNALLNDPELFINLDYVTLGSELTHPDKQFREEANEAYMHIINVLTPRGLCTTRPLLPHTGDKYGDLLADTYNMFVPLDR